MANYLFMKALLQDKPIVQFGDGTTGRDYTYIGHMLEAMEYVINNPFKYEIFNLGNGDPVVIEDMINTVAKVTGKEPRIIDKEERKGEMPEEFYVKVKLEAIKEKVLPEIDDEFAKSVGPFEDLKALEKRGREDLQQELEEKNKNEMIGDLEMADLQYRFFRHGLPPGCDLWQDLPRLPRLTSARPMKTEQLSDTVLCPVNNNLLDSRGCLYFNSDLRSGLVV